MTCLPSDGVIGGLFQQPENISFNVASTLMIAYLGQTEYAKTIWA